ncbi:Metalloendopeptidase OMA1, mitochondrial [Orchesella cincta]|uniref:Metalloendopeptidase OMA1, mitochondrial n=1 Tax=Orchesella cincta TaxID=48709 RepID=A0A1D2MMF5_ORCCI|nr:Metalloendopeptidase OMA1, mitochondrial [Orchesella cincta]
MELSKEILDDLLLENEGCIIPATSKGSEFYNRVVKVSQQLIKGNSDLAHVRDLDWTVTVVYDDKNINAFVLGCGSIFVYSGMLLLCDNDDQLGIILGHEMAHAILSHSAEEMSLLNFWEFLYIIPLTALWAVLPSDLTAFIAHWIVSKLKEILMELPHSRFMEEEADKVGLILAAKACFDIREASVVWAKMKLMDGDDSDNIAWLSTHPTHGKRQQQLDELVQDGIDLRESCQVNSDYDMIDISYESL